MPRGTSSGDGLANKTVLSQHRNPRLSPPARLFTYIQIRRLFDWRSDCLLSIQRMEDRNESRLQGRPLRAQTVWFLLDAMRLEEIGSRNQCRRDFFMCGKLIALSITF